MKALFDCSLLPLLPQLPVSFGSDILSGLLLSHFLIFCMRSSVLPGNRGRDVVRQVQYVVNSLLLVSVSKVCACACVYVCIHTLSWVFE